MCPRGGRLQPTPSGVQATCPSAAHPGSQGAWSLCTRVRNVKPESPGQFEFGTGWSCLADATISLSFGRGPGALETPLPSV